jgi:hypothetical protein
VRVVVDLASGSVSLGDPDDMARFAVLVRPAAPDDSADPAALGAVAAALSVHDVGTVDPDGDAFIAPGAVRRLARAAVRGHRPLGADWDERFDAMVEQAAQHGWVADDGAIRAHIEWEGS